MSAIFGYARVSKADAIMTTANQRLELEQAGYAIDYWFEDVVSGSVSAMTRPGFSDLMVRIRAGETIVVSKLDRLGRDAMDVMATLRLLDTKKVRVIVHGLGGADMSSPSGKLLITMLAAVAEMERDLIIERTRSGIARAKSQGKRVGRPPKTTPADRKEILDKLLAGETVTSVARAFQVSRASIIALRTQAQGND